MSAKAIALNAPAARLDSHFSELLSIFCKLSILQSVGNSPGLRHSIAFRNFIPKIDISGDEMARPDHFALPGLLGPAEVLVDKWGIPHIYASCALDAFRVQGFNVARERLWQIDLWRKRGLGQLAADFGPAYVQRDTAARLLLYRGDMSAEWRAYGTDAQARVTAFADGINAFVAWVLADADRMPAEFKLLGSKPALWSAEDVVRIRSHGRIRNVESEIQRVGMCVRFGMDSDFVRKALEPSWKLSWPSGLPLEAIPSAVMEMYRLGTEPVTFYSGIADTASCSGNDEHAGSNNWVLSPARTTTGRPLLASDPHRTHEQPSLRYIQHLAAPGLNVIGSGEPAVPGISLGHNERVAFGLTIFPIDQEDLIVYELDPSNHRRYRQDEGWRDLQVISETVDVCGAAPLLVDLLFTHHGPLLHIDAERNRAYGLRSVWFEPGTAPYLASLRYLEADNWDQFVAAMKNWGSPGVNQVYADVDGNIGWITGGMVPVRPNADGLFPVTGDSRYEWHGFLASEDHPRIFNPAEGWLATANHMNLPPDYPISERKLGFEWSDSSRFQIIKERLGSRDRHSPTSMMELQASYASLAGRRLCLLIKALTSTDTSTASALRLLNSWDHQLTAESAAAALFQIWFMRHLIPSTINSLVPGAATHVATPDTSGILTLLENPDHRFGTDPCQTRDRLLLISLASAWKEALSLMGPDRDSWSWGRLHQVLFEHPLSPLLDDEAVTRFNVGRISRGGSAITVNYNSYRESDFRVVGGATFRMVIDVGNWDASWTINAPGQSGDQDDPHYRDLFDIWGRDAFVPMLFSRAAVEAAVDYRIELVPSTSIS